MTVDSVNTPADTRGRPSTSYPKSFAATIAAPRHVTHKTTVIPSCGSASSQAAEELRADLVSGGKKKEVEEHVLDDRGNIDFQLANDRAGEKSTDNDPETERADL